MKCIPGKESLPGWPILVIEADGTRTICQQGEGFGGLAANLPTLGTHPTKPSALSPATLRLMDECQARDLTSKLPQDS